jgi:hypothetical protein
MRSTLIWPSVAAVGLLWLAAATATAQQVVVSTPFHALGDSFFEHTATQWGLNYKGLSITFGGLNMAAPSFGLYDPSAGIHGGFAILGPDYDGFFNFTAGQGFRRNFITQAPLVTLTDGQPGYVSDTSQSPFVVGVVPVVGGLPLGPYPSYALGYPSYLMGTPTWPVRQGSSRVRAMLDQLAAEDLAVENGPLYSPPAVLSGADSSPPAPSQETGRPALPEPAAAPAPVEVDPSIQRLAAARSSSAGRPAPSVAEARRRHQFEQAAQDEQSEALYNRGLAAERSGRPGVAEVYYGMALEDASDQLRDRILERLRTLRSAETSQ